MSYAIGWCINGVVVSAAARYCMVGRPVVQRINRPCAQQKMTDEKIAATRSPCAL